MKDTGSEKSESKRLSKTYNSSKSLKNMNFFQFGSEMVKYEYEAIQKVNEVTKSKKQFYFSFA